jgi:virginiamycin B lyase
LLGGKIGRIAPSGSPIAEFPISSTSRPSNLVAGPDGKVWFVEYAGNKIGRMTVAGVLEAEYALPTANSGPSGIVVGPDKNIWVTEYDGNKIARVTLNGDIREFAVPTPASAPNDITVGPDGSLWFTEVSGNKIGRFTP